MIRLITLWLLILGLGQCTLAQTQQAAPVGGVSRLALYYFKINFSKEQRALLEQAELELIYEINEKGKPTLEKVNGISDQAIMDSLVQQTRIIPYFNPKMVDGVSEPTIYFMKLRFPQYSTRESISMNNEFASFRKHKPEDFEFIEYRGAIDLVLGGMINTLNGSAQNYLSTGGGMKVEMLFLGRKNDWGGGFNMNFYGNKLKQDYPIISTRPQASAPPTMFMGMTIARKFNQLGSNNEILLQVEANLAMHNVVYRQDSYDNDYVQFIGFSPALVVHYNIPVGKGRPGFYHFSPIMNRHHVNLNIAVRPLFYDNKAANGTMIEFGVSWRSRMRFVDSYKLK